jgi:hypothetical protein
LSCVPGAAIGSVCSRSPYSSFSPYPANGSGAAPRATMLGGCAGSPETCIARCLSVIETLSRIGMVTPSGRSSATGVSSATSRRCTASASSNDVYTVVIGPSSNSVLPSGAAWPGPLPNP